MESLIYKLQNQQKAKKKAELRSKPSLLCTKEDIAQIVKHFPKDMALLTTLIGPGKAECHGVEILKIIKDHPRDQDEFMDCVREMEAFTRGGECGMYLLDRLYRQIMGHFKMMPEINEIFEILQLYTHITTGKLKRKFFKSIEDEDVGAPWTANKRSRE